MPICSGHSPRSFIICVIPKIYWFIPKVHNIMSKASPKYSLFSVFGKEDYLYNLEYDNKKNSLIYIVAFRSFRYYCLLVIGNYSFSLNTISKVKFMRASFMKTKIVSNFYKYMSLKFERGLLKNTKSDEISILILWAFKKPNNFTNTKVWR